MSRLRRGRGIKRWKCCMRVISEKVNGGDIGHVHDELRFFILTTEQTHSVSVSNPMGIPQDAF